MTNKKTPEEKVDLDTGKPPILGSWRRLYAAVLILHAFIIFLFWIFTKIYS